MKDDGDIIFVDTVGTFRPERIVELSTGKMNEEEIFKHMFLVRARTTIDQINVIRDIDGLASSELKMIIIDTLTNNFVYDYPEKKHIIDRQSSLARHLHDLASEAIDRDISVVVTNTVRVRIQGGESYIVETGGNTVTQGVHVRVQLERIPGGVLAKYKESEKVARFKIGKSGIMDWKVWTDDI